MSKTEDIVAKEWQAVCAKVGAMVIKLHALEKEEAELRADIARAAHIGISLDHSAHWANKVEEAIKKDVAPKYDPSVK